MKNKVKLFIVMISLTFITGCYDRDIIDSKDFNYSMPDLENISISKQDNMAVLTWQFPSAIPDSYNRPLEVNIQVIENDIYRQKVIVFDEATTNRIEIDPTKEYRFVLKLAGYLTPEAKEDGFTDRVLSNGVIVVL